MSLEVEFLVGKVAAKWDPARPTEGCPYSYQVWVDSRTLLGHLRRLRVAASSGSIQKGAFPYYLFLCQMRIKGQPCYGEFKYLNILDLDVPNADEDEIKSLGKQLETMKGFNERVMIWFTGKKGFRAAYCPVSVDDTEIVQIRNGETKEHIERFMDEDQNHLLFNYNEEWRDVTQRYLDTAPWYKNRGFKMDIYPHPVTGKLPTMIRTLIPEVNECINPVYRIATFWADLTCMMEMKLRDMFTDAAVAESLRHESLSTVPAVVDVHAPEKYEGAECSSFNDFHSRIPPALKAYFRNRVPTYFRYVMPKQSFIFAMPHEYCQIHQKQHASKDKIYYVWRQGKAFITCHCRSSSPVVKAANGYKIFFQEQFSEAIASINFLKDAPELRELVMTKHTSFYPTNHRYVRDLIKEDVRFHGQLQDDGPFILFVKAGMGCGKTEGLRQLLLATETTNNKKIRVLAISTRRTCAGFLSNNFGCVPYINLIEDAHPIPKNQLSRYDRICISMESLRHLSRKTSNGVEVIPKFDVVILDEIETILSLFPSETMSGKRDNFLLLAAICKKAQRVFAMDALLGSKTIGFFRDFNMLRTSLHYSILFNQYICEQDKYIIYNRFSYLDWRAELLFALQKGKRVTLVSDRKNAIHVLFQEIQLHLIEKLGYNPFAPSEDGDSPKKKALIITGASPDADKATAVDCNFWAELDFLAFSPVITVGNSDTSDWDDQFCLFRGNVLAATAIQMSKRARNVLSRNRHVLILESENIPLPSLQGKRQISEVISKHDKLFRDEASYLLKEKVLVIEENELPGIIAIKRPQTALRNLVESCKAEEFASKTSFKQEFERLLTYAGISFVNYPVRQTLKEERAANDAALNRLRKRSQFLSDENPFDSKKKVPGDIQSLINIKNTAVERFMALGAPLQNSKYIKDTIFVDEFMEFQKTHPQEKTAYRNNYLLYEYKDCSEIKFLEAFERHKTKPDEYGEPFWFFIKKMAAVLDTEYFRTRKTYFSVSLALEDKEFVDSFKDFSLTQTGPLWEVYANIFPKCGSYPETTQDHIVHFIEITCPFFGIYFKKVSVREHRSLKKLHPKDDEIPPPTGGLRKQKNYKKPKLYSFEKEKNENVRLLGRFMHSAHQRDVELLPEKYPYRKYFLSHQNDSLN